jgi:hypothetical protein
LKKTDFSVIGKLHIEMPKMADKCTAILATGEKCTKKAGAEGLCGTHVSCRNKNGPIEYERIQLGYVHKREKRDALARYNELRVENPEEAATWYYTTKTAIKARHKQESDALEARIGQAGTTELDRAAQQRREDLRRERIERREEIRRRNTIQLWQQEYDRLHQLIVDYHQQIDQIVQEINLLAGNPDAAIDVQILRTRLGVTRIQLNHTIRQSDRAIRVLGELGVEVEPPPPAPLQREVHVGNIGLDPDDELAGFAADKQNVHTTAAVKHTTMIVEKVRQIPVPEGYRWNIVTCSKTPGEIIAECELPLYAATKMMEMYADQTAIYDIEHGIYGKVLDSMWQFVKAHPEKKDLVKIIRVELKDNIGMCAQGNLTRICNILSGYIDGVGVTETTAEKMGRLLPPLRDIEDSEERRSKACAILGDNGVPKDEWDAWLDAVMD